MKQLIALILTITVIVGCGNGNKKVPFDYRTLPTKWIGVIRTDVDNEFAVCNKADTLTIKGDILTIFSPPNDIRWEVKILNAYQTHDTLVFNVRYPDDEKLIFNLKFLWLDKKRGIAEWFQDNEMLNISTFVANEKLLDFPKARCFHDEEGEGTNFLNIERKSKNPDDFVRSDETLFEKIFGDLNSDGKEDCVIITKQTKEDAWVTNEYSSDKLDRNRRGILIAFNEGEFYNLFLKIPDCFSSENEDGGVYFAPELYVEIFKGNLRFHYGHGRYGWWRYIFRNQNDNFELIGYDESNNRGPVVESSISINFLTKKQQTKINTNLDAENESEEVVKETWQDIKIDKLVKLTDIADFDEFRLSNFYTEK